MSNQWFNTMRNKMEDHEEDVPEGLWEDIREDLFGKDKNAGIVGSDLKAQEKISKMSTKSLFYRIAGVAAIIAVFIIGGRELISIDTEKNPTEATIANKKEKAEGHSSKKMVNDFSEKNKEGEVKDFNHEKSDAYANKIAHKSLFSRSTNDEFNETIKEIEKFTDNQLNKSDFKQSETEAKENMAVNGDGGVALHETDKNGLEEEILKSKPKTSKNRQKTWMLSMLTGSTSQNSAEQFPGYASLNGATMSISDEVWSAGYQDDPLMAILLANQDKQIDAKIKHKIPVTVGFSLYRNLGKKWGIGIGVNYTRLSTELQSGSTSDFIKSEQTIHYVGVPVQVNYNVIQKGRFTGYLTAGGVAEKAVAGDVETQYIVNGTIEDTDKENIHKKPVQISVNSALGLQLKVIDRLGIYAEPGIGYHFKDNSSLNTIYKDKPLNFNMKFGVRLIID